MMAGLIERVNALEHQTTVLQNHTRHVTRQLRWWRGLACGMLLVAVLTWSLPTGTAQEETRHEAWRGLPARVAALEELLKHFSRDGNEVTFTGANLRIVNGLGSTDTTNGLGNLIVGYNEPRDFEENIRTGSHNVGVGRRHNFSRFGGLVVGDFNTISGDFASVSGGRENTASGLNASVSGGVVNTASGLGASVSGGQVNTASGEVATVSGGILNMASGSTASVSGGEQNTASGLCASVSGGNFNTASGSCASVSGGGGNTASGQNASVSGGLNRTAEGDFDWVAGSLFEDE